MYVYSTNKKAVKQNGKKVSRLIDFFFFFLTKIKTQFFFFDNQYVLILCEKNVHNGGRVSDKL